MITSCNGNRPRMKRNPSWIYFVINVSSLNGGETHTKNTTLLSVSPSLLLKQPRFLTINYPKASASLYGASRGRAYLPRLLLWVTHMKKTVERGLAADNQELLPLLVFLPQRPPPPPLPHCSFQRQMPRADQHSQNALNALCMHKSGAEVN